MKWLYKKLGLVKIKKTRHLITLLYTYETESPYPEVRKAATDIIKALDDVLQY